MELYVCGSENKNNFPLRCETGNQVRETVQPLSTEEKGLL
jgi:hypothetical protein